MLIELNEDTLQDLVSNKEKVVVQFSASWCGNCRIMKPKFKKLASENENLTFVLVDAENSPFILQRALYESMVENPLFCMCRWSIFSSVDGWILITNWRKILPFLGEYSPTCRHM